MIHKYILNTWEVEAGETVQGHPWLHSNSEVRVILGYVGPCLKKINPHKRHMVNMYIYFTYILFSVLGYIFIHGYLCMYLSQYKVPEIM